MGVGAQLAFPVADGCMGRLDDLDKDEVLDAAVALVREKGAGHLTLSAVASEFGEGLTKSGVQSLFGTKKGLIDAMLDRWCDEFDLAIRQRHHNVGDDPLAVHIRSSRTDGKQWSRDWDLLPLLRNSSAHQQRIRRRLDDVITETSSSAVRSSGDLLSFFAVEGLVFLRLMGLITLDDARTTALFDLAERSKPEPDRAHEFRGGSDDARGAVDEADDLLHQCGMPTYTELAELLRAFAEAEPSTRERGQAADVLHILHRRLQLNRWS